MQRPVMDITYMEEDKHAGHSARRRFQLVRVVLHAVWQTMRRIVRILTYNPLSRTPFGRFRNDDGSPLSRFLRGVAYRLAFVPVFAALTACAFVYSGTHPTPMSGDLDPSSVGIYFEAVSFKSADNVRIDAWLVPSIDASKVLDQKEKILREKRPAVVLLHNYGDRRQQMLSLVRPLHDAGFVVLLPAMRGCGTSESVGQTFGLHEALDVKAAIDLLRRRPFVDPDRVMLVGVGSGANAAMLAANTDKRVLAMVLESPADDINQVINEHVAPKQPYLRWLRPMCKWTFEISYEVDAEELNASRHATLLKTRSVLMLPGDATSENFATKEQVEQIRHFLVLKSEEKTLRNVTPKSTRTANAGD
ncbi:MAG: alpha/beta hydrolase [Anaerolineae bacterium]|nr:alpha/beta hydrolase [Phycisphaerae bacterium]